MGKPASRRWSARRPGKRERARVKNFRGSCSIIVGSAGTYSFKAGRKKWRRFRLLVDAAVRIHQAGNLLNAKMLSLAERLPYNVNERPVLSPTAGVE